MKTKLLFVIGLLITSVVTWGQGNIQIKQGNNYYLNPIEMFTDANIFQKTTGDKAIINTFKGQNYILTVKNVAGTTVYFKFWKFVDKIEKQKEINGEQSEIIYEMPLEKFSKMVNLYYNRVDWQVGFFNVPYKLRFKEFDFTSNINAGLNLSAKIRMNRRIENGFALAPMVGIGVTGIDINTANSNSTTVAKLTAYTVNTGGLVYITENINVGILVGWDILSATDQKNYGWKYNGKPWLGLGINFSFSVGNNSSGGSTSQ